MKKQTILMRLFSVMLCLAMLCTFAPLTSLASSADAVFVGGIEATSENADDVLGDGTVSYNAATKTLTLNNASITDFYYDEDNDTCLGIYAKGDLNVVVKGNNLINLSTAAGCGTVIGIAVRKNATVSGDGNLTIATPGATDVSYAVCGVKSLSYTVTGDSQLTAGAADLSYALSSEFIIFDCGCDILLRAATSVFSSYPTILNEQALYGANGYKDYDGTAINVPLRDTHDKETIQSLRVFRNEIYYMDYYVCGVQISTLNANDVLGDGTVSFDFDGYILTLNNANLTKVGFDNGDEDDVAVIYSANGVSLCIDLIGDNVIDASADTLGYLPNYSQGIYSTGSVYFTGDGNLTCKGGAGGDSYGVYCEEMTVYGTGDYKFYGAKTDDSTTYSCGLYADYSTVTLYGSRYAEDEDHGVYCEGDTKAVCGTFDFHYLDSHEIYYLENPDDTDLVKDTTGSAYSSSTRVYCKSAVAMDYDVVVCDTHVTSNNLTDVLGDGTVSYRPRDNTLVLNNATLTKVGEGYNHSDDLAVIYSDSEDFAVELIGDNTIDINDYETTASGVYVTAIETDYSLGLYGEGSLTVLADAVSTAHVYGIFVDSGSLLISAGVGVSIKLPETSSYGITADSQYIYSSVRVSAARALSFSSFYVPSNLDYFTSDTYGGTLSNANATIADSSLADNYKELEIKPATYKLWVAGTQVTAANYFDILGDGTCYFYPYSNSLYLNNATISGDDTGISIGIADPFVIYLEGENHINVSSDTKSYIGGISASGYLGVKGNGSLDITASGTHTVFGISACEARFTNNGDITVTIEDGADFAVGVQGEDSLDFSGEGDITVTIGREGSEAYGIFCNSSIDHLASGSLFCTVDGAEGYAEGIYCDGNLTSFGNGIIKATAGDAQTASYGLEISGGLNLQKSTLNGNFYDFKGKTMAINADEAPLIGNYAMRAVETAAWVTSPSLADLDSYRQVQFYSPYVMNHVSDLTVSTEETATVTWSFPSTTPDYVYVYYDENGDGCYETPMGGGAASSMTSLAVTCPNGNPCVMNLCVYACFGGEINEMGTVAIMSNPFTVTFYETLTEVELEIDNPQIGQSSYHYFYSSLEGYLRSSATLQWYELLDDSAEPMQPGDTFIAGHSYGAQIACPMSDCYHVSNAATVSAPGSTGSAFINVDDTDNIAYLMVEYDNLQDSVSRIYVDYGQPVDGATPQDLNTSAYAQLNYTSYAPIARSTPIFEWSFNTQSESYNASTAEVLAEDAEFIGGNYYALTVTIPLKDMYKPNPSQLEFCINDATITADSSNYSYDAEENTITFFYEYGRMEKAIDRIDFVIDEPSVGATVSSLSIDFQDIYLQVNRQTLYMKWYKMVSGNSSVLLSDSDVFAEGEIYYASICCIVPDFIDVNKESVVTVNGVTVDADIYANALWATYTMPALTAPEVLTELDFTVLTPVAGTFIEDSHLVSTGSEGVAYMITYWYVYDENTEGYEETGLFDVFEEGKQYAFECSVGLSSGYEAASDIEVTVNGDAPSASYPPPSFEKRSGIFYWAGEALAAPTITLDATGATSFTVGDEGLANIEFVPAFNFEPEFVGSEKKVAFTVTNKDGNVVFAQSYDSVPTALTADLSDDSIIGAGNYTATLTAFFRNEPIVSNEVAIELKAKPTTTASTTATTASKTEPTGTATATDAEPTATATATGTEADTVLRGDANGDNSVNMKDVLILRKQLAGMEPIINMTNADVNGDGNVNMKDVLELRKFLAGIVSTLGGPKS